MFGEKIDPTCNSVCMSPFPQTTITLQNATEMFYGTFQFVMYNIERQVPGIKM